MQFKWLTMIRCVLYSCIVAPYKIAFLANREFIVMDYIEYCIDSIFILDVILNFFTAYYDNNLNLITNRKVIFILIAPNLLEWAPFRYLRPFLECIFLLEIPNFLKTICCNYLMGWFIFDALSSFPFTLVLRGSVNSQSINDYARLSKIPKMMRLLRLSR